MGRRPAQIVFEKNDPLQDAVDNDRENIADALATALDALSNVDQGTIKGILYKIPVPNGKYEWIRDIYPPFDMSDIMRSLKEDIGGGDYALRIMAEGKPRKTIHFAIMKDRQPLITEKQSGNDMTMMMFQMMMQQSRDAAEQRAADMRDRQAASERQTTMIVGLVTAAIPLIVGQKDKTSEVMTALGPFINRNEGDSTEKTLVMLKTAKELFGDGGSKDESMEGMVANGVKLIGPALKGIGDMVASRGRQQPAALPAAGGGEFMEEVPALSFQAAPPEGSQPVEPQNNGLSKYAVINLIRDDVLYFYKRNHDPEKAADMVYDTIEAHDVSEDAINELATAFALSSDPLGDLAREGLDLRGNPEWANGFLAALIGIHANSDADDDDRDGGEGGLSDTRGDGEMGDKG